MFDFEDVGLELISEDSFIVFMVFRRDGENITVTEEGLLL